MSYVKALVVISVLAAISLLVGICPIFSMKRLCSNERENDGLVVPVPSSRQSHHGRWHEADKRGVSNRRASSQRSLPLTYYYSLNKKRRFKKDDSFRCRSAEPNRAICRPCGAKHPNEADRIMLGEAFANYDMENPQDEDENGIYHVGWVSGNESRGLAPTSTNMVVPVYFHVFIKSRDYGQLSFNQIQNGMMASARKAFSGTGFQFRIRAVKNYVNATWAACNDARTFRTRTHRGGPGTLNVWICDLASKGLGGTASYPPIAAVDKKWDGITMLNPALGNADFAREAFVHELGHWFGLLHTFADGCNSNPSYHFDKYPDYYVIGDGVPDTPAHRKPTWLYSPSSFCWRNDSLDTCPNRVGFDPVHNYMNYLPGECFRAYGRFTKGQRKRMRAQWFRWRDPKV